VVSGHKKVDGHTLVNQSGNGVGIIRAGQDDATLAFGALDDGFIGFGVGAQDDAGGADFDGEKLRFKAVADDDHVVFGNVIDHSFGCVGGNGDPSLVKGAADIAADDLGFQNLDNIFVWGFCLGNDAVVIDVHVGRRNVGNGDQPFQMIFLVGDAQCACFTFLHQAVRLLDGNFGIDRRNFLDLHVGNAGAYICQIGRRLYSEVGQGKGGFLVQITGAPRGVLLPGQFVLQIGIGDGGTDRIGVRAFVSDNDDLLLLVHSVFSSPGWLALCLFIWF